MLCKTDSELDYFGWEGGSYKGFCLHSELMLPKKCDSVKARRVAESFFSPEFCVNTKVHD